MVNFLHAYSDQELPVICYHNETEGNESEDSGSTDNTWHVVVKGSLKKKLPPYLSIKSTNLKILDPIGQGTIATAV